MKRLENLLGFSIVELLIAMIIIGVLAGILAPTLAHRAREAKKAACERELENIADAQERAAVQLSYYLRLYALDDLKGGDGRPISDPDDRLDGLADETLNDGFYNHARAMFIDPETNDLLNWASAETLYNQLVAETLYWGGPYYTIHHDEAPEDHDKAGNPPHLHDTPTDPWGNDYVFFLGRRTRNNRVLSDGGAFVEPAGVVVPQLGWFGKTYDARKFDRPTILSMGPDGVPGDGETEFGEGDDLYRSFGY
ncbi:MAG TPA: prepilin-type N-terminal cleavage/methylation domain-containing protein [Sumerlaeia bacterium]|nr:prepilin-type N-terminal cleavage/methylation domain-containing protein [Sumerlaeia bacterium]